MKFIDSNNFKKYINDNISDIDILAHYLDVPNTEIIKCINNKNYRITNPFREDNNPSYGIQYFGTSKGVKLHARDFANPFYSGDIFDIVGLAIKRNSNNPYDFNIICRHIINTFKNSEDNYVVEVNKQSISYKDTSISTIDVHKRQWDNNDMKYWGSMGFNYQTLIDEKIYPIDRFYINGIEQRYVYHKDDLAYAYYLGFDKTDIWEVYRPFASKELKFRTNNFNSVKELHLAKTNTNLILSKSKKDKALLIQMLKQLNIDDVDVLYMSESEIIKGVIKDILNKLYRNIFIMFDLDMAGINAMKYYKINYNYNILPFIIDELIKIEDIPKDPTDFSKQLGYNNALKVLRILYTTQINKI